MIKIPFFKKTGKSKQIPSTALSQRAPANKPHHHARTRPGAGLANKQAMISFPDDYSYNERVTLYRFLRENIPVINGAIWVWVRLCSSPMEIHLAENITERNKAKLRDAIDELNNKLAPNQYYKTGGLQRLSDLFFNSLFVDGAFAGNIDLSESGGINGFSAVDLRKLVFENEDELKIYIDSYNEKILADQSSFIYIPLDDDVSDPRGKSILQSIGFVSRLEQKLLDDMQKSQEKAGYNRMHVLIKKPERRMGESEPNYIDRANDYFDDTVKLFSGIKPSDSAVTWDDIEIKTIGPGSGATPATSAWYLSHRALVEDICAGVHLDPFMLGYSFGTTQTWAGFKYELVLRQIVSVQKLAIRFFEWLINNYLKHEGHDIRAEVRFDNNGIDNIFEKYRSEHEAAERVMELFKAGLLTKEEARERIFVAEEES